MLHLDISSWEPRNVCFAYLFIIIQMNVKKAMDKLTEWNNAGEKLRHHIPSNDEVLHSWLTQLEEFSQDLPFLLQLSSDALKVILAAVSASIQ